LNPSLTGVLLSVVPIVSLGAVQYGKFMKKLRQQFQDRLGDAGTQAEESLSSIRTVRTFSGENKAASVWRGCGQELCRGEETGCRGRNLRGLCRGAHLRLYHSGAVVRR